MRFEIGKPNIEGSKLIIREELNERYKNGEKIFLCECHCGDDKCKGLLKVRTYYLKKIKTCIELIPRFQIGKPNIEGSKLIIREELNERYKNGEKIFLCECHCGDDKCKGLLKVRTSDLKKIKTCLQGRPKKKNAEKE